MKSFTDDGTCDLFVTLHIVSCKRFVKKSEFIFLTSALSMKGQGMSLEEFISNDNTLSKTGTPVEDVDPISKLLRGVSHPEVQLGVDIHGQSLYQIW